VYKIKLDTGMVGILGLDLIMAEVRSLEPLSEEEAKRELLKRASSSNYIPDAARDKYADALYREYIDKLDGDKDKSHNDNSCAAQSETIKILGTGCKRCAQLEKRVKEAVVELGRDLKVEKVTDLNQIIAYGVLITPGLVMGNKVVSIGRVPAKKEIINWIKEL